MAKSVNTIVLTDEETNEQVEFEVISALDIDGDKYILVIEKDRADDEEAEAIIFKQLDAKEDDEVIYELIEDEEEFEKVAEQFMKNNDEYDMNL
jgi:uncharacterized protein YrzB (UPF0473 family)